MTNTKHVYLICAALDLFDMSVPPHVSTLTRVLLSYSMSYQNIYSIYMYNTVQIIT